MRQYEIVARVSAKATTVMLAAIEEDGGLLVRMHAIDDETKSRRCRYAGGKRNKGISSADLMVETLALTDGEPKARVFLERVFAARGFSKSSVSPTLSLLIKRKKVRRLDDDRFELVTRKRRTAR